MPCLPAVRTLNQVSWQDILPTLNAALQLKIASADVALLWLQHAKVDFQGLFIAFQLTISSFVVSVLLHDAEASCSCVYLSGEVS